MREQKKEGGGVVRAARAPPVYHNVSLDRRALRVLERVESVKKDRESVKKDRERE